MKHNRVIICELIFCIVVLSAVTAKAQGTQQTIQIPLIDEFQDLSSSLYPYSWTAINPLIGGFGFPIPWYPVSPLNPWFMINPWVGSFGFMNSYPMVNSAANYSLSPMSLFSSVNPFTDAEMEIVLKSANRCILGPIGAQYTIPELMSSGITGTIIPNSEFTFYDKPYILVMPDFFSTPIPVPHCDS